MEKICEIQKTGKDCSILKLRIAVGEIDLFRSPRVEEEIHRCLDEHPRCDIILDVDNLSYIDSTGIAMLVSVSRRIRESGKVLVLVCTVPQILQVLGVVEIDRHIQVCGSVDDAARFFERFRSPARDLS